MSESDRDHDIVVWGATGVAGRLLAEYLAGQYTPDELALALGGRDEERLGSVGADIRETTDAWAEVPIVLGDATDPESLRALAAETDVVATTVGPYTNYGSPLVEACIETGTDYCDLTGEINWIREVVDEYHNDAVAAEARIINSCGFDSVPADMGTLLVQSYAAAEHGAPCEEVRIYVDDASGGVSGGTLASFAELFEAASEDPVARETLRNPYSLAPPGEREGVDRGARRLARKDRWRSEWTAPSPMAAVNERVVRRSNALLDYRYGREFRCSEVIPTGRSLGGAASASLVAGGIGLFTGAMSVSPLRSLLSDVVFPDPGEGPSEQQMENGYFLVSVLGRGTGDDGEFTVQAEFGVDLDPGYGATARMLGESAMCLLRDEIDSPLEGGVLTPASGIGMPLAERLRDIGFTATVGEADG
ncbi:oxidoreductase [Haloglomus irregulare]|uniref:Oxidoreductase n=1 Tax=Haloglomus irregulare TaxID=2234134 RepID=A0A554MWU4_9EURY|nr:saccharopine dehydrogenase NADP-binding domain-containing protein [Haloglomus irregulare]TSD09596.1 oxidoreductase [Haloglomus irregulare]